jgi:hypothetical protein
MKKNDVVKKGNGKAGVVQRAAKDNSWVEVKEDPKKPAKRVSTKHVKHA